MGHGQIVLGQEQRRRLLAMGIRFFLAAALTASQAPGGYAPFALGCVAAAGGGASGAAARVFLFWEEKKAGCTQFRDLLATKKHLSEIFLHKIVRNA